MKLFVTLVVFLATASAENFTIREIGISSSGARTLQLLSLLDQLRFSIFGELVVQTNRADFCLASEVCIMCVNKYYKG